MNMNPIGDGIRTQHIRWDGLLYLLPNEKRRLIFGSAYGLMFQMILALFFFVMPFTPALMIWIFVLLSYATALGTYLLMPAYRRAILLRAGVSFHLVNGHIEIPGNERFRRVSYKDKKIKVIERNDGVTDIVIGESIIDFLSYFGTNESVPFALCGLTNGDDVISYINKTK